jgi:hypothetical protein
MRSILDLNVVPQGPAVQQKPVPPSPHSTAAEESPGRKCPPVTPAAKSPEAPAAASKPVAKETAPNVEAAPAKQTEQRSVPISEPVDLPAAKPDERSSPITNPPARDPEASDAGEHGEYELVLGRRQIASCLFAATVLMAIFTGAAYFAGKMSAPTCAAASSIPAVPPPLPSASIVREPPAAPVSVGSAIPVPDEKVGAFPFVVRQEAAAADSGASARPAADPADEAAKPAPANTEADANALSDAAAARAANPPLFASPRPGSLYLQVGAVERGIAAIIAEGLRDHGLSSFVAPGPSERIFRVLIGPFANQDEYMRAKAVADGIDINSFARAVQK